MAWQSGLADTLDVYRFRDISTKTIERETKSSDEKTMHFSLSKTEHFESKQNLGLLAQRNMHK